MVSLRLANGLLVFMSVLFALSLQTNVVFVIDAYLGMLLAGQLVSAATRPDQRPNWARSLQGPPAAAEGLRRRHR